MVNLNKFYTYIYLDQEGIPFYVGKGKGKRYIICAHLNKYNCSPFLVRKIKKIGIDNVVIEFALKNVCEECALCCEVDLISIIGRRSKREGPLVNLSEGGEGISGYIHTKESKQKISEALKGKPAWNKGKNLSDRHKQKISNVHKGRIVSDETRWRISKATKGEKNPFHGKFHTKESKQKMSEVLKGHKVSDETKQKISRGNRGKTVPDEVRQKISDARKGKRLSNETKRKISDALKGKSLSDETKRKMSEAAKRR